MYVVLHVSVFKNKFCMKKKFFFLMWELFHHLNFWGGNFSRWELLGGNFSGWDLYRVGTFPGNPTIFACLEKSSISFSDTLTNFKTTSKNHDKFDIFLYSILIKINCTRKINYMYQTHFKTI